MFELKRLALIAGLLLIVALGWRYRNVALAPGAGYSTRGAASSAVFKFDNGTNRDLTGTTRVVPRAAAGPRRCQRGESVIYTDGDCPPGTKEAALGKGTVNVVKMPRPAPPPQAAASMPQPGLADRVVEQMTHPR